MLSSVRAMQKAAAPQAHQPALPPGKAPVAADSAVPLKGAAHDPNAAVVEKLSALILAGRPGMPQELTQLIDAIGKAINLPRQDAEGDFDYALRLVEGLKSATPAQRIAVEKLLKQLIPGADLKLILAALKNPTGPAAAKIVALVEAARFNSRELAIRTVVTSYRQSAENPREQGLPRQASHSSVTQPGPQRGNPVSAPAQSGLPPSRSAEAFGHRAAVDLSKSGAVAAPPARETGGSGTGMAKSGAAKQAAQQLADGGKPAETGGGEPPRRGIRVFQSDIQTLQTIAKAVVGGGREGGGANARLVTLSQAGVIGKGPIVAAQADPSQSATSLQKQSLSPGASAQGAAFALGKNPAHQQTSFVLKAFGHGAGAAVALATETLKAVIGEAQIAAIRSMKPARPAQLATGAAQQSEPRSTFEAAVDRATAASRPGATTANLADIDNATETALASKARGGAGLLTKETIVAQERPASAELRAILRDGIPFAAVNYLPAQEALEARKPEDTQRDADDEPGDGGSEEQQAFAEPDSGDDEPDQEDSNEPVTANAGAEAAGEDPDDGLFDFGYGLYRRNQ